MTLLWHNENNYDDDDDDDDDDVVIVMVVVVVGLELPGGQEIYTWLIINENLSKNNQNRVHDLSCQAVRRTAYVHFCSGRVLKGLGLGLVGPGLGLEGCALAF